MLRIVLLSRNRTPSDLCSVSDLLLLISIVIIGLARVVKGVPQCRCVVTVVLNPMFDVVDARRDTSCYFPESAIFHVSTSPIRIQNGK